MFDSIKFKRKYPFAAKYITDSNDINWMLNSKLFETSFMKQEKYLVKLEKLLGNIYSKEIVNNFIKELILKISRSDVDRILERLENNLAAINVVLNEMNESIDIIKAIDIDELTGKHISIRAFCHHLFKYYIEKYNIDSNLLASIFMDSDERTEVDILIAIKEGKIESYLKLIEQLHNCNIDRISYKELFDPQISLLTTPDLINNLSEKEYKDLITYYFSIANKKDKPVILKIIEVKNFDLLKITINHGKCFVDMRGEDKPFKYANLQEKFIREDADYKKDIFSLLKIDSLEMFHLIITLLNLPVLSYKYYSTAMRVPECKEICEEYKDILKLIEIGRYEDWKKLTLEEKEKIINIVKNENLTELREQVTELNNKILTAYKGDYAKLINGSTEIIDKAETIDLEDSKGREYSVPVYELKDEMPFTFLITAMKRGSREMMNMYGRPLHRLTIDDPSNFEKDLPNGSEIISTSMIDQTSIQTFIGPEPDIMYIFGDIKPEDILGICPRDAAFSPKIKDIESLFSEKVIPAREFVFETRMATPIVRGVNYNEIAIRRKGIKPTAILCFDEINDDSLKHAEYFQIPIIVIKTKTYRDLKNYTNDKDEEKSLY